MALEKLTIRKSDYSGKEIPEGTGARIRVMFLDTDRLDRRADITDAEVDELLAWTTEVTPRPDRRGPRRSLSS